MSVSDVFVKLKCTLPGLSMLTHLEVWNVQCWIAVFIFQMWMSASIQLTTTVTLKPHVQITMEAIPVHVTLAIQAMVSAAQVSHIFICLFAKRKFYLLICVVIPSIKPQSPSICKIQSCTNSMHSRLSVVKLHAFKAFCSLRSSG